MNTSFSDLYTGASGFRGLRHVEGPTTFRVWVNPGPQIIQNAQRNTAFQNPCETAKGPLKQNTVGVLGISWAAGSQEFVNSQRLA